MIIINFSYEKTGEPTINDYEVLPIFFDRYNRRKIYLYGIKLNNLDDEEREEVFSFIRNNDLSLIEDILVRGQSGPRVIEQNSRMFLINSISDTHSRFKINSYYEI